MLVSSRLPRLTAALTTLVVAFALLGFTAPAAHAAGTATWKGGAGINLSTPANWEGGAAPSAGDDLVFPAGAAQKQVSVDTQNRSFGSITIAGAGYDIAGFDFALTGSLSATYTSGKSIVAVGVARASDQVQVAPGGTLEIDGTVSGTSGLTLGGGGSLALEGSSTYTGTTTVGAGVLEVNGSIVSPVVLAGGTLSGAGILNGNGITGTAASTVAPGRTGLAGILAYRSNSGLTLPIGSTFRVDLDGSSVGSGYDQLKLTSGSALFNPNGANLEVDLGYVPSVNTSFQIVAQTFGSPITGRFNGISQFGSFTSGPVTFSVGYFNSGIILTVTAVKASTWTGGGTTGNWSEAANWDAGNVPTAGSVVTFPAGVAKRTTVNDLAAGTSFSSVTVADSGYTVTGSSFAVTGGLRATFGSGTSAIQAGVTVTNAEVSVDAGGTLNLAGPVSGGAGIIKSGGGTLLLSVGNSYSGVTAVNAGTLAIANSSALGSSAAGAGTSVASGATLEIRGTINTGEQIRVTGTGVGGVGALYNGTGNNVVQSLTMAGDASIGTAPGTFMLIPSALGESGGAARMTKVGAGVLDVLASAAYTGGTTVVAGTLAVEGTIPGALAVASGATLSGAGGQLGDVTSTGGTVTAGFSTSPFTSDARSMVLESTSTFAAQLNGTTTGDGSSGHSRLVVAQGATLGGAALTVSVGGGYAPAVGDTLTILTTTTGVSGTFKDLPEGGIVAAGGRQFRISYVGGDGNDITLTSVAGSTTSLAAVPNPSLVDQSVTFTATVTPGNATGTVTFKDGATTLGTRPLANGVASYTTSGLALGSHSVTASYSGSASVAPSTSSVVTQVVADPPPDTSITAGPANASENNPTSASFSFTSPDADIASFECSLDGATFTACASPKAYAGLAGGSHTFAVRGIDIGGKVDPTPASRTWKVTGVLAVTGTVTINGTAKVGQTLTAASTVATTPTSTSVTGQWFRGQTPIQGATGTTYVLTNDDVSATVTYRETRSRTDYAPVVITTAPTATVTGGVITLAAPTISGTPVVDGVLTATAGSVSPATATVVLTWNVDGTSTGVTGSTYAVEPGDVGKAITVTARATKDDYDETSTTSAATAAVAKAAFSTGPTATISGVLKVGETLTAGVGTSVPEPDSYTYQWFAGDTAVEGATGQTFTLGTAQKGLSISVEVAAVRAGYVDATDRSDASAVVVTNLAPDLTLRPSAPGIRLGQSTTLSWTSADALILTAAGGWAGIKGLSGAETVTPSSTGTQTFSLTATNDSGSTTAQVSVEVALPAEKLTLKADGSVEAGRKITVSTTGLAPREPYTVRVGGVKVATGSASTTGQVKRSIRVPSSTKVGRRTIEVTGSLVDRTGSRQVKVTSPRPPRITLRSTTVRASGDQRITVRGLQPSAPVKVTYQGRRVSPKTARASAEGVYTLTFDVGRSAGRATVTVNSPGTGRSTSKEFSVRR